MKPIFNPAPTIAFVSDKVLRQLGSTSWHRWIGGDYSYVPDLIRRYAVAYAEETRHKAPVSLINLRGSEYDHYLAITGAGAVIGAAVTRTEIGAGQPPRLLWLYVHPGHRYRLVFSDFVMDAMARPVPLDANVTVADRDIPVGARALIECYSRSVVLPGRPERWVKVVPDAIAPQPQ